MKIKKSSIILTSSMISILILSLVTMSVSINIGAIDGYKYLNSLPDFNWSSDMYGDHLDFQYQDVETDSQNNAILLKNNTKAQNWGKFIDYNNFSTGYQWRYEHDNMDSVRKQAVTGAPMSKIFMPNGNFASDFGMDSKARKNIKLNSFLNWDPSTDMDAKFNKSSTSKREATRTLLKWAPSQSEKVNSLYLGFTSNDHRAAVSANVGVKNPFNNTFTSYQYANNFDDWGGSFFEGIIKIPSADAIDAAHNNGGKIYANIFLDGFNGLTRRMLVDFLKKDDKGDYLIVDKILEMAKYFGFDGFFWNNEPNGDFPNGTILDNSDVYNILSQLKNKINQSNDERIKKLKVIFYRNSGSLNLNEINLPEDSETNRMSEIVDGVTVDFGEIPDKMNSFLSSSQKWSNNDKQYDIFNIIEPSNTSIQGMYDTRMLTNSYYDSDHNKITKYENDDHSYNNKKELNNQISFENNCTSSDCESNEPINSYSFYQDEGATRYSLAMPKVLDESNDYNNWLKEGDHKSTKEIDQALLQQQVTHIADEMLYSGRNRFIRGAAHEADPKFATDTYENKINWLKDDWDTSKSAVEKINSMKITTRQLEDYGVTTDGWNYEWKNWGDDSKPSIDQSKVLAAFSYDDGILPKIVDDNQINSWNLSDDQLRWLFAKDEEGNFVYSFGGADIQQESTIINDNNPDFSTNFSTGSGVMFAEGDGTTFKNYPWSNKRLQDTTPTYNWDVINLKDPKNSDNESLTDGKFYNYSQNKVSGFYDYYNPYLKGNSIALAKKLNYDGSLKGFDLSDKKLLWNIMGANLSQKNIKNKVLDFKFKFNTNQGDDKNSNQALDLIKNNGVKIQLALTDGNGMITPLEIKPTSINDKGWYDAKIDLSTYAGNVSALAKIGIIMDSTTNSNESDLSNVIFNVGEMSLKDKNDEVVPTVYQLDAETIQSEYVIQRDTTLNARIAWEDLGKNISYYEVYVYDPNQKSIYRLGETTQNIYYIHSVLSKKLYIGIKPISINGGGNDDIEFKEIVK